MLVKSWGDEKIHELLVGPELFCGEESGIGEIKAIYILENSTLLMVCFHRVHNGQMYGVLITLSLVAVHTHTLCIYILLYMYISLYLFIFLVQGS